MTHEKINLRKMLMTLPVRKNLNYFKFSPVTICC
ncbi:hypothetical protein X975_14280, partial [Stegodyphus mimosarum]